MSEPTSRFFLALRRRRFAVLAAFAVVFLVSVFTSRRISWHEDVADLLPSSDPVVHDYSVLFDTFRPADRTFVVVRAEDGSATDLKTLFRVADGLAEELQGQVGPDGLLDNLTYRAEAEDVLAVLNWMRKHRASYFSKEQQAAIEAKLAPEEIARALAAWKKQFLTSPAPALGAQMAADPIGFDATLAGRLDALRSMRGGLEIRDGRMVSSSGDAVLIMAEPRYRATDSGHARAWIDFLDAAIARAKASAGRPVRIITLSGHRFSLENAARVKDDIQMVVTLSVVGVSILAYLALGRILAVLLVLVPALFGATFSLGVLGVVWPDISAIALGCGAMFVGISVDYGIHLLYHAADRRNRRDEDPETAVSLTAARLSRPLGLSAGTTLVAFAVLGFSILPGYRQLGAFASLGILGAATFTLFALPLMAGAGDGVGWFREAMGRFFLRFRHTVYTHRPRFVAAMVGITVLALAGIGSLRMEGDYRCLNGISPETRRQWNEVEATFGAALESALAVTRDADPDKALRANERIAQRLEDMRRQGSITGFRSVASVWPAPATREANRERWKAFWTEERVTRLHADLDKAARAAGFRPEAFEPFIKKLRAPLPPPPRREGLPSLLADAIGAHIAVDADGRTAVLTALRQAEGVSLQAVAGTLRKTDPGVLIASGVDLMDRMSALIARELVRAALAAMVVVALLLAIVLRRVRSVALFLAPVLLSVVWTLGFLGLAGIHINLMNSIVCAFIFGLVVDYCVFLLSAAMERGEEGETHFAAAAGSVAMSALTTLLALGALGLAHHPALRSLGLTALAGIGTGWFLAMLTASLTAPRAAPPKRES